MQQLPPELLQEIVKILAYPTCNKSMRNLSSLRKVDQVFKSVTTPFLFESVPLWIGINSLRWLYDISINPELSKCVRRIVFTPFQVGSRGENQEEIHHALNADDQFHDLRDRSDELDLGRYISARLKHSGEQSYLVDGGVAQTALGRVFHGLKNLEELQVLLKDDGVIERSFCESYGVLASDDYHSDANQPLQIVIETMNRNSIRLKRLYIVPTLRTDPLSPMIKGRDNVAQSDQAFRDLLVAPDDFSNETLVLGEIFVSGGDWTETLGNLQELALTLPTEIPGSNPHGNSCDAEGSIIKYASKHLVTIGLAGRGREERDNAHLFNILTEVDLPQLRRIYLYCLAPRELIVYERLFAKRFHALEIIQICGIKYTIAFSSILAWSNILERMRRHPWDRLRSFRVSIDPDSGVYEELAAYLKSETDEHAWRGA